MKSNYCVVNILKTTFDLLQGRYVYGYKLDQEIVMDMWMTKIRITASIYVGYRRRCRRRRICYPGRDNI